MLETLTQLKDFLADRPSWAFLAISLALNVYLLRGWLKEKDDHRLTVTRWLPMIEHLSDMIQTAAKKTRVRSSGASR